MTATLPPVLVMIDLDNTLADRQAAVARWIDGFVAERGLAAQDAAWIAELDNDGYSSRLEVFTAIKAKFALPEPTTDLLADYQADVVDLAQPVAGAHGCLEDMRDRGWQIAIVTNGSTKQQNAKIDRLGFRSMVDVVAVSETLGIKKPDPAIFEHAAAACRVHLGDAATADHWIVGDSPTHDIEGGQAVGLSTAWMPRGRRWPPGQQAPTVIIDDLASLPSQIVAAASAEGR